MTHWDGGFLCGSPQEKALLFYCFFLLNAAMRNSHEKPAQRPAKGEAWPQSGQIKERRRSRTLFPICWTFQIPPQATELSLKNRLRFILGSVCMCVSVPPPPHPPVMCFRFIFCLTQQKCCFTRDSGGLNCCRRSIWKWFITFYQESEGLNLTLNGLQMGGGGGERKVFATPMP